MDSSLFKGNFGCINENWLSLWRWDFFHPYDLVLISELSKRSKLYHFNVLKCNFYFIINSWQKFKSLISVFKHSQCCRGAIYILFFLDLKTNYDYGFMKEIFNCYLAAQWPTLGHCWGGNLTSPMLITAFSTYSTRRSPGALKQGCVP